MKHKIRIHLARMETKYGTDVTTIVDDPVSSRNTTDVIDELMGKLNYTENEDNDCDYPGHCDGIGAYFDYDGYIDVDIPESIVERIKKGESK